MIMIKKIHTFAKFLSIFVGVIFTLMLVSSLAQTVQQQPSAPSLSFRPKFPGETGTFSTQAGPVGTYQLGPITFHIPKGYQPSYYKDGTNDGAGAIMMFALLPDLSPRTEENKEEFDAPGWGRKVEISIQYKQGPYTGDELLKIYTEKDNSSVVPNSDFQEGSYKGQTLGIMTNKGIVPGVNDLFTAKQPTAPAFFICDGKLPGIMAKRTLACHVIEARHTDLFKPDAYGKNLMSLEYVFQKTYISSVEDIDVRVNNLIDSFEHSN